MVLLGHLTELIGTVLMEFLDEVLAYIETHILPQPQLKDMPRVVHLKYMPTTRSAPPHSVIAYSSGRSISGMAPSITGWYDAPGRRWE